MKLNLNFKLRRLLPPLSRCPQSRMEAFRNIDVLVKRNKRFTHKSYHKIYDFTIVFIYFFEIFSFFEIYPKKTFRLSQEIGSLCEMSIKTTEKADFTLGGLCVC